MVCLVKNGQNLQQLLPAVIVFVSQKRKRAVRYHPLSCLIVSGVRPHSELFRRLVDSLKSMAVGKY